MPILHDFEYVKPETVDEAVAVSAARRRRCSPGRRDRPGGMAARRDRRAGGGRGHQIHFRTVRHHPRRRLPCASAPPCCSTSSTDTPKWSASFLSWRKRRGGWDRADCATAPRWRATSARPSPAATAVRPCWSWRRRWSWPVPAGCAASSSPTGSSRSAARRAPPTNWSRRSGSPAGGTPRRRLHQAGALSRGGSRPGLGGGPVAARPCPARRVRRPGGQALPGREARGASGGPAAHGRPDR